MSDLEQNWQSVHDFLSPHAFRCQKTEAPALILPVIPSNYLDILLPSEITRISKQSARRHHGVHGYFTRQVWSVVQKYIDTFTRKGDLVLDPFGGSGVTLIEALVLGRKAIQIDINPLSKFIVKTLVSRVDLGTLTDDFGRVLEQFNHLRPRTEKETSLALKRYPYPRNVALPSSSDVDTVDQLFRPQHLAELALLKHLILKVKDNSSRQHLLLMFSGLLNKTNLTYHASGDRSEGRGDSGVFRYYRYRVAHSSPYLDPAHVMQSRFKKIVAAKQELKPFASNFDPKNYKVIKGTASALTTIKDESVDYIYTDPPYGAKIPYLDLSTMWNAWLDLKVTQADFDNEAIEGGEGRKSKGKYSSLLAESIREMFRVLKYDRWLSFVFAHKDPAYWHLIVGAAEASGFEYAGVVRQNNGQSSFKKRQHPFTVLSGQLIINFKKVRHPKSIMAVRLGLDVVDIIEETIEATIALHQGATIEQINDGLVIRGLELGFLHILSQQYNDLTPFLKERFLFDINESKYYIKANAKFKTHIDLKLRVRYFLISFLRRQELQRKFSSFDDIVLSVMPLLKNGITPETQTILSVLEAIAEPDKSGRWRLRQDGQGDFGF